MKPLNVSKMVRLMKQASLGTMESGKPVAIQYATVTQINPLEVNVDQRFPLSEDFLIVPEHMTEYKITIGSTEYTIRQGLKQGDGVILLRVQGGQQFIILGKVV
jgi:hypothetical protein